MKLSRMNEENNKRKNRTKKVFDNIVHSSFSHLFFAAKGHLIRPQTLIKADQNVVISQMYHFRRNGSPQK